jgi:hypothetical protein
LNARHPLDVQLTPAFRRSKGLRCRIGGKGILQMSRLSRTLETATLGQQLAHPLSLRQGLSGVASIFPAKAVNVPVLRPLPGSGTEGIIECKRLLGFVSQKAMPSDSN